MSYTQVLSTESVNSKGFSILNQGLDWTMYLLNPILLHEHAWGDDPIGTVQDIHFDGEKWVGTLVFGACEKAQHLKKEYSEYRICGVSVAGVVKTWGQSREDGTKVATSFQVFEISLVDEPSNADAMKITLP